MSNKTCADRTPLTREGHKLKTEEYFAGRDETLLHVWRHWLRDIFTKMKTKMLISTETPVSVFFTSWFQCKGCICEKQVHEGGMLIDTSTLKFRLSCLKLLLQTCYFHLSGNSGNRKYEERKQAKIAKIQKRASLLSIHLKNY